MAYRAEPEGVIAVVEAPHRELPAGREPLPRRRRRSRSRATSARWRARPRPPAPTRSSSPRGRPTPGTRTRSAPRPARCSRLPVVEATLDEVAAPRRRARRGRRRRADAATPTPTSTAPDGARRRRRRQGPAAAVARRRRPHGLDPARARAAPTASTRRPPPRSSSSRRCGSVVDARRRPPRARGDRRRLARTPTLDSRTLGARLKCELFQRTGSFKARGALNKLSSLTDDERARGVITISAGNHAQAVAYAAARDGRRRAGRDVARRLRAEDRGDARLRRDRRPRGDGPGAARSTGSHELIERDRAHARPPVRRPGRPRRRGHGRPRDRGGRARRRRRGRRRSAAAA